MPLSLHTAEQQLHEAMANYRKAHDAATADDRMSNTLMLEVVLATIERARENWNTERGLKLLDSAERHVRAVLGMEDAQ